MDEEIRKILEDHERRISLLEKPSEKESVTVNKELSLKEFMISKKPTDDIQKTLVIGYFLEKYRAFLSFNVKDMDSGFREAKEKVPANMNDYVNKSIKKGYLMETKEKKDNLKAWTLTNLGERFLENNFKDE